jgi:hypothetical protein
MSTGTGTPWEDTSLGIVRAVDLFETGEKIPEDPDSVGGTSFLLFHGYWVLWL